METLKLLKEEINKTMESEHDLAKWKLGVTAALGAVALGVAEKNSPHYWLLLFIPYVCAYIDLHAYQYQIRILVISSFIRQYAKNDDLLKSYEDKCYNQRQKHDFDLGNWACFSSSLGASILGPVFCVLHDLAKAPDEPRAFDNLMIGPYWATAVWGLGAILITGLWFFYRNKSRTIENEPFEISGSMDDAGTGRVSVQPMRTAS